MRVSLISPYSEISSLHIRSISAVLKSKGIHTRLIFLPLLQYYNYFLAFEEHLDNYPRPVVDALAEILKEDDLIGISVMSPFFATIKSLTEELKRKIDKPIVWGGVHPTLRPEECIGVADYVCVGEGEKSFVELCSRIENNLPTDSIQGIWAKRGSDILRNGHSPVTMDLDSLPFPDFDLEDNYILNNNKIIKITNKNIQRFLGVTYWTYYTRGCPFHCSFCCNDALRKIDPNITRLRSKTPNYIIKEIKNVSRRLPFIRYIYILDDTLFALSEKKIKELCDLYKKEVGLPFITSGIEPTLFSEKKFDYLVEAGMIRARMGIQTGSKRILDMYNRGRQDNELIIRVADKLQKYSDILMMPTYDILLDNPWETEQDTVETINLVSELKPPFTLNTFSLTFLPGTELTRKAIDEGLIHEEGHYYMKHPHNKSSSYYNLVVMLFGLFKLPKPLVKFLLTKKRIESARTIKVLIYIVEHLSLCRRGMASVLKRDFSMFPPLAQLLLCKMFPPANRMSKSLRESGSGT